jgi:hypothetical protein
VFTQILLDTVIPTGTTMQGTPPSAQILKAVHVPLSTDACIVISFPSSGSFRLDEITRLQLVGGGGGPLVLSQRALSFASKSVSTSECQHTILKSMQRLAT